MDEDKTTNTVSTLSFHQQRNFNENVFINHNHITLFSPLLANKALAPTFINVFNEGPRLEVIDYVSNNMSENVIERFGIDAHVGDFLNSQNTYGKLKLIKGLPPEGNNEIVAISNNNKLKYNP